MKSEDHAAFESQMRKYYKRSTSTGVSSMNRETEAVEKWKESELQGTGTVKLGTSDCSSGSHHSGAPDWGCDFHFLYTKSADLGFGWMWLNSTPKPIPNTEAASPNRNFQLT